MVCARSLRRGGSLGRHSSSSVFARPFPRSRGPQLQPRPRSPANCSLHPREEAVARKEDPGKLAEEMEGGGRWLCLPRRRERWHPGLPATRSPSLQLPLPTQQPPVQAEVAACRLTPRSAFQTKQQQETSMKFKRETAVTPAQRVHACLPPPTSTPPSSREGKSKGQPAARQPLVKPPRCPNPRAQQSGGRAGGAALVPSLPCEAAECLGSVVCPMGMRRNEGAVRRGEVMRKGARGRRKSAALRLRGLGSSRGLLRTSRAGWGAGCRT